MARFVPRGMETLLLVLVTLVAFLGFTIVQVTSQLQQDADPLSGLLSAWVPPAVLTVSLFGIHLLLSRRRVETEQIVLPIVGLLIAIGVLEALSNPALAVVANAKSAAIPSSILPPQPMKVLAPREIGIREFCS